MTVLVVSTIVLTATPAAAGQLIINPFWVTMRAHKVSSACLDVKVQDPRILQIWQCSGAGEKIWEEADYSSDSPTWRFRNKRFGTCIGALEVFAGQGARDVQMIPCGGFDDPNSYLDKWKLEYAFNDGRWYQVWYSYAGGRQCLARIGGTTNGVHVGVAPCDRTSPAQQWDFFDAGPYTGF